MRIFAGRIAPLAGSADLNPAFVRDLLWRERGASEHIEHIRVRAGPDHLDIVVYTSADTRAASDTAARSLINRTLASTPELRLWRLI